MDPDPDPTLNRKLFFSDYPKKILFFLWISYFIMLLYNLFTVKNQIFVQHDIRIRNTGMNNEHFEKLR